MKRLLIRAIKFNKSRKSDELRSVRDLFMNLSNLDTANTVGNLYAVDINKRIGKGTYGEVYFDGNLENIVKKCKIYNDNCPININEICFLKSIPRVDFIPSTNVYVKDHLFHLKQKYCGKDLKRWTEETRLLDRTT